MAKVGGTAASSGTTASKSIVDFGFAKLQGENFEYYMQTYSIILGRNSKKSVVDVDLRSLGGGLNISRLHARLFYVFERKSFALEVIGKNGCLVQGVFYSPEDHLVELHSQDLLQFGDLKFYFLLPTKSIFASAAERRNDPNLVIPFAMPTGENQLLENADGERNGEEELVDDQILVSKKETRSLQEVVRNYAISTGLMDMAGPSVLSGSLELPLKRKVAAGERLDDAKKILLSASSERFSSLGRRFEERSTIAGRGFSQDALPSSAQPEGSQDLLRTFARRRPSTEDQNIIFSETT